MSQRHHRLAAFSRVRWLLVTLATIIVLLTSQVTRIAAAGLHFGSMACCCGVHQSDEACGCPDCPAGHSQTHDDRDEDKPAPMAPSMKRCGPSATIVALGAESPWAPPITASPIPQKSTPVHSMAPLALSSAAPHAPDAPPPRGRLTE
ncbi:MAG TPA: hypothetical protein PLF40_02250 [Kofleriaceae bacterium]|nr:hypothetical protein [Kofleriaceae bacterium]